MTTPISPEDLDKARAHNPDYMNEDSIDKLVARVEELEGALREAGRFIATARIGRYKYIIPEQVDALAAIDRVLEGTE